MRFSFVVRVGNLESRFFVGVYLGSVRGFWIIFRVRSVWG